MKGSEIDDPGHLIGLKPRRFPNWGARQQPIKFVHYAVHARNWCKRVNSQVWPLLHERLLSTTWNCTCDQKFAHPKYRLLVVEACLTSHSGQNRTK